MLDAERVTKLAEAVADGQAPDWSSADHLAAEDRELIAELRAVASIGALFGTISGSGSSSKAATPRLAPGSTWATLHILEHVGAGRFGDVYRAWDPALDREVALKLMSGSASDDASDSQVVEEGRLMARVHHPNVVSVFGAQRIGETTGLWMEFVEGRTLADELLDRGPFSAGDLVSVGVDLCRALQAVHEAGLVHRDVKTQNVMRDRRGRVVLGDFGVGRDLQDDEPAAGLAGTPAYIAPEVFARQPATPRSDLYSLGALLFHLATRRYPVEGRTLRSLRDAHENGARVSLATLRPDLPANVTGVIDRALSVDPLARYATADEMAAAFEATRAGTSARPTRRRLWAAAAVLVVGAAAAAFSWVRPAPAPGIPFEARDWVLISAFENRAGEPVLDGTLEFLLERELSNSAFVNVVPRARVVDTLQLMQRPQDTRIDATVGREVAVRDGQIRGVVTGRIDKVGDAYTMTASVMNPADGVVFASVSGSSSTQEGLLDAVGRLAVHLRERLGETLPAMPTPASLPKVTTRSLRALQLYAQALTMQTPEGTWPGKEPVAAQLLTRAIEADPEFASAHMLLSVALRLGPPQGLPQALHHAEQALALSDDVSEVERLVNKAESYAITATLKGSVYGRQFSDATAAEVKALFDQAIAAYEAALALEPTNYQALIGIVNLQRLSGRRDARVARQLADLRPNSAVWQMQAAWALLGDNNRADALRYIERARAVTPVDLTSAFNVTSARLFDAYEAWLRQDARNAASIADRVAADLLSAPRELRVGMSRQLGKLNLALGRLDQAEQLAAMDPVPNNLAIVAVFREDRALLRRLLAQHYPSAEVGTGMTSAFVEAGLVREARLRLETIKQWSSAVPGTTNGATLNAQKYLAHVEGQILVAEGRHDAAIALLDTLLRHESMSDRWVRATRTLAHAWAAKSDFDRAIRLLEGVPWRIDLVAPQPSNFNSEWLRVRDYLAQLYRKVGRDREAEAVDTQLLKLLAVADEDHPVRRRATARLAGSTASARSARPFHARDWVLVADTDDRTDAALDAAVRLGLEQQLRRSARSSLGRRNRSGDWTRPSG